MAELKIDLEKVEQAAVDFRVNTGNIRVKFKEINKLIDSLDGVYNCSGTDEVKKKYSVLRNRMEELLAAMNNYSDFLEKTTKVYDSVEKRLSEQAADMIVNTVSAWK